MPLLKRIDFVLILNTIKLMTAFYLDEGFHYSQAKPHIKETGTTFM